MGLHSKKRVLEGNDSWMGQGGTPWLSYYPGDSNPEQVVHPSQSSEGGNSWGGGSRQPSSSPTRELRAPCHWALEPGSQFIYSAPQPSLGVLSMLVRPRTAAPEDYSPGSPAGPLGRELSPLGISQPSCPAPAIPLHPCLLCDS